MSKVLSVVIPCKNEGNGLIKSIASIKFPAEIIVADSSTDNTRGILSKIYPEALIINGGLPSVARNRGFELSRSEYTLFMDADMDISGIDLKQLLSEMKEKDLDLLTCRISTRSGYRFFYDIFYLTQRLISPFTPFAVGGFMLFKSEKFREIGGFDEDDLFAEDFHLSLKVSPQRFKISKHIVYTSDRRLRKKSPLYMGILMTRCWLNRKNPEFYKKDYNYWK